MTPGPLVSVLMPTYDRPFFLRTRSIPSVLRQSYTRWELIVVGDGPADDAVRRAVEGFDDPRIRYAEIRRPDYSAFTERQRWFVAGAAARNHALDIACGDVICPLDDDDEFLPNHLADCVNAICGRGFDLVFGSVLLRDIEAGTERVDGELRQPSERPRFPFDDVIFHSSVGFSGRFRHLRYSTDGTVPDDHSLWKQIFMQGGRFARLAKPQSVSYGETLQTEYRLSIPSRPDDLPPREPADAPMTTPAAPSEYCGTLELALTDRIGVPVVSQSSYEQALVLALSAVHDYHGDRRRKVIVPAYADDAILRAVLATRHEPVFADVDPGRLCLTADLVSPLLAAEVAAIVAMHAHAPLCDMAGIADAACRVGAIVIGEASAGLGSMVDDHPVGSIADMEVFGLTDADLLACGGGGALSCANHTLFQIVQRLIRGEAVNGRGSYSRLGAAASRLGLRGLESLDARLARRRQASERYCRHLANTPALTQPLGLAAPRDFVTMLRSPEETRRVRDRLRSCRVCTSDGLPILPSLMKAAGCDAGRLSGVGTVTSRTLSLPFYDSIRDELIDTVAGIVSDEVLRS